MRAWPAPRFTRGTFELNLFWYTAPSRFSTTRVTLHPLSASTLASVTQTLSAPPPRRELIRNVISLPDRIPAPG